MEGLMQVAGQLIMYPDSREFILKAIAEWSEFYRFPLNGEKMDGWNINLTFMVVYILELQSVLLLDYGLILIIYGLILIIFQIVLQLITIKYGYVLLILK
jgi:hypothetical protein